MSQIQEVLSTPLTQLQLGMRNTSSPHFPSAFTIIIFVLFTLFLLILIKTILGKLHSILTSWKTTRFNFLVVSINCGHGKRKISQEKRGCFWIYKIFLTLCSTHVGLFDPSQSDPGRGEKFNLN